MTLKEALIKKAEEVFDLHARGMLTELHKVIWNDILDIIDRYPDIKPINLVANDNNAVVRIAADERGNWKAAIRYKVNGAHAHMIGANSYGELEAKVRVYFAKNKDRGWIKSLINRPKQEKQCQ